jgi:MFS family permease
MLSNRAAIGGGLTLAAAAALRYGLGEEARLEVILPLVLAAALLWALGALAFAAMEEETTATGGGRSMLRELGKGVALFRTRPGYRRFIAVRGLLLSVELAMPFYALHAAALLGTSAGELGLYIFAVGLANVVSSPLWGALSDRDSKTVLAQSGALAGLTGLGAVGLALLPTGLQSAWLYAALFLVLGVAVAGVRLGRKTYLVDGAPADERPLYTAFANTVVGAMALAGGLVGLLADLTAPIVAVAVLAALSGVGALAARGLPAAADMARADAAGEARR